jgi:hypothetical protein
MPYINAAQISGNLGKDAETMTTQGGRTVTRFSIVSTKKWMDKANKTHESTDWFRVAAWGNLTKFASSLKKGDPVFWSRASCAPVNIRMRRKSPARPSSSSLKPSSASTTPRSV